RLHREVLYRCQSGWKADALDDRRPAPRKVGCVELHELAEGGDEGGVNGRRQGGDLVDEHRRRERPIRSALCAQAFADDTMAVAITNAHASGPIVRWV